MTASPSGSRSARNPRRRLGGLSPRRVDRTVAALAAPFTKDAGTSRRLSAQKCLRTVLMAEVSSSSLRSTARRLGRTPLALSRDRAALEALPTADPAGFRPPYARGRYETVDSLVGYLRSPADTRRRSDQRRRAIATTKIRTHGTSLEPSELEPQRHDVAVWWLLHQIELAARTRRTQERQLWAAVQADRSAGMTWADIAERRANEIGASSLRTVTCRIGRTPKPPKNSTSCCTQSQTPPCMPTDTAQPSRS